MSDLSIPHARRESLELAAAHRRLTTVILGMTLLTGLVACLSYLAGRTITNIKSDEAEVVRREATASPLIIEPTTRTPAADPPPEAAPAAARQPMQVADPSAFPAVAAPAAAPARAPGGALYFQVGLMNAAADRSMQDRLIKLGFNIKLEPMDNSAVSRVLVGPIHSAEEQREFESKLAAGGFQFFRRYL